MTVICNYESQAWLRATAAGVELPADVQQARANAEKVEAELAKLGPPLDVPKPSRLVAAGVPLEQAQAEHAKLAQKAAAKEELRRIALEGRSGAWWQLNKAVEANRDELVVQLRPLVTAIIDEARPLAEVLRPFAPSYSPGDMVRRGDAKTLKAWQDSEELERRFGLLISAWRASLKAAGTTVVDPREVQQEHRYWSRPELVSNERLNGNYLNRFGQHVAIEPTVLGVAAEPAEAGFRLATVSELAAIYAESNPAGRTREQAARLAVRLI